MGILTEWITEWLKGLLIEGIMGNLEGLFDTVNTRVGEISVQVGTTPAAWNAGVFSLIRQLSETVILPIAGLILTFVATYELIQMILEKNNMHEFDVANIYKWVFKTTCAILILSNTFNIVMAVFDVSQSVIASAAGIVTGATDITPDMLADLEMTLETMELGSLLGLFLQSFLIKFTMLALNIFIFVIVYGRMIEIYLLTSLAPIPVATLSNRELGSMGQNYLRSLFAVGFQDMLLTDPPYGTTRNFWDVPLPLPELWEAVKWAVKPEGAVLFFAQCPYDKVLGASNLPMLRYEWVWYKSRCTGFLNARRAPLKKTENILVFYQKLPLYNPQFEQGKPYKKIAGNRGDSTNYGKFIRSGSGSEDGLRFPGNVLAFPTVQRTVHPTQKPVALSEYFIKTYTRPGEVVADICAGSGTTAVAALNTGRRFICFETVPAYYAAASERIRAARAAVEAGEKGV